MINQPDGSLFAQVRNKLRRQIYRATGDARSRCLRTLRGEGHSAAGWGIGGSVIAAACGVQSPFVWAVGCRYLRCTT